MLSDRLHDLKPRGISIQLVNLPESLINIRHASDHGRSFFEGTAPCFPIKGIAPSVVIKPRTTRLLEYLQKMNCSFMVRLFSKNLGEKSEAHGIVSIRDWKALWLPEQASR